MSSSPESVGRARGAGLARRTSRVGVAGLVGILQALAVAVPVWAQPADKFPGVGRTATPKEVAAWDIDVRPDFKGLPQGSGSVVKGQDADFQSNYFDLVVSCECFEHNLFWIETFANMIRMLRPGGVCIITCASIVRGEHGTPRSVSNFSLTSTSFADPYYKNLDADDFKKTGLLKNFHKYAFFKNIYSRDLYLVASKLGGATLIDIEAITNQTRLIGATKKMSLLADLRVKCIWRFRYIIAKTVGEQRYHDFVHFVKKKARTK